MNLSPLSQAHFRKPLHLSKLNTQSSKFPAYVDVDEKFSITDKLSMVNTLLQMENVTSYPFMRSHKNGRIHIHAFWFDIYTGEVHCFSRKELILSYKWYRQIIFLRLP